MPKKEFQHLLKKENQIGKINKMENIETVLKNSKTIAMIGVSSLKKKEDPKNLKRKPSTIVMKYMQDFGYKVYPINPFAEGEIINGEKVSLTDEEIKELEARDVEWEKGAYDRALEELRMKRNQFLVESDWTQFRDVTLTKDADWKTYRQSLRDITKDLTTVDDVNKVTWPTKPS